VDSVFLLVMSEKNDYSFNGVTSFWKKRWLRIAPAFYTACVVYGLHKYGFLSRELLVNLSANFIFLQPYIPGTEIAALFWSLSVEWLFYLMLPSIFMLIGNFGYIPIIFGMVTVGLLLNLLHYSGYIYAGDFAWYYTIFANFEHFGWGILIGFIFRQEILLHSFLSGIAGFCLGLLVSYTGKIFFYSAFVKYMGNLGFIFESIGPLTMTLGFSIMILSSLRNNFLNRVLSSRILVFVGRISFSFYLWHMLILELCFRYFRQFIPLNNAGIGILAIITLIFLIPLSYISYYLLESFYFKLSIRKKLQ
jgi:peptidoglycan/LPS O-acetylase OafA/YrhL